MLVAAETHARNAFELLNKIDFPFMLCYTCVAINDQCVRTDTNRNMPDACVASTFWAIIFLGDISAFGVTLVLLVPFEALETLV